MAATDNDALLKAMDQLMKEEDRASVIEYAKQLSTKGGDVVGTMRKMSQQGVDTKKDAAMWKKRALLTAAVAVVVCAVMFGLMVASAEMTKETRIAQPAPARSGPGRQLGGINSGDQPLLLPKDEAEDEKQKKKVVATAAANVKKGTEWWEEKQDTRARRLDQTDENAAIDANLLGTLHQMEFYEKVEKPERRLDEEGRELQVEQYRVSVDQAIYASTLTTITRRLGTEEDGRELGTSESSTCVQVATGGSYERSTANPSWKYENAPCGARRLQAEEDGRELKTTQRTDSKHFCDCASEGGCAVDCQTAN